MVGVLKCGKNMLFLDMIRHVRKKAFDLAHSKRGPVVMGGAAR